MEEWSIQFRNGIRGEWPKTDLGDYEPPALLEHVAGDPMAAELQRSLLDACGIPTVCRFPNDGELGNVLFGYAGGGVDIFVPESLLEDARNIITSDMSDEPTDENNEINKED